MNVHNIALLDFHQLCEAPYCVYYTEYIYILVLVSQGPVVICIILVNHA